MFWNGEMCFIEYNWLHIGSYDQDNTHKIIMCTNDVQIILYDLDLNWVESSYEHFSKMLLLYWNWDKG